MISLEKLNDQSVEEILDDARDEIVYLSDKWTDFQEADPGITLIELFSWLTYNQHEYLNTLSSGVQNQFLKLLDVKQGRNKGSETYIEVSGMSKDVNVPVRTKWRCGGLIFENLNYHVVMHSKILSVDFENSGTVSEQEYYKFDGSNSFYAFGKDVDHKVGDAGAEKRFTINFDGSLPKDSVFNIYFSIYNGVGLKRNPIERGDFFEPMAKIKWEYYGEEKGVLGWHEVEVVVDNTHDLLFSGIIKFRCKGKSDSLNGVYKLRATLIYDEYDYPPRINGILTNVLRVCQNDTQCDNVILKKEDINFDHTFKLTSNLGIYGRSEVYLKKHDGWVRTNYATFKTDIKNGETTVDLNEAWKDIKILKSEDEAVMVVSYDKNIIKDLSLGSGTGISAQEVELDVSDVLDDGFEIMISEKVDGEEVFYKWTRVDDFFSSGKSDRHYVIDKVNKKILFGDHEHGMAPRCGLNNIRVCMLRNTKAGNSNTKEGMIKSVITKNKILSNVYVNQILPAKGGENEETLEHAKARASEMFSRPGRVVTIDDYKRIVKSTPGLMFTNVRILPNYMPGEDTDRQSCITVAVRWNRQIGLKLPKSFEKNIMHQIDKYRLVNTKVKVVSPAYIGLVISGDISVSSSYRISDNLIENEIKRFVEGVNKELGQPFRFGDLFGMIDRLKYVSCLNKLRISPIGEGATKNAAEDIIIPPNGVYYVDKINFNYVRSSEF